jgi:CHAD domain-containing protein
MTTCFAIPAELMANNPLEFVYPNDQGFSELITSLQNAFPVRQQPETVSYRIFYDTVDWLLYNNGSALEMIEDELSHRIYWRADKNAQLRIQLGINQVPQLASELPQCEFRKQLSAVISVRELTPRIKVKIKRIPLLVLGKNGKVVVRMNLDENWFYPDKVRAGRLLTKRLTVKPVKGYAEAFQHVEGFVRLMELRVAQDNLMKLALAESGSSTVEHSTKLNLHLDPEMTAEKALKEILLRLLEIMQRNTAGSIKGKDIEFMHDYRVSIRKTRSALALIKNVLPRDRIRQYNKFFSSLGKLTNPVRDLDVFLLKLGDYQHKLANSKQEQLQPLRQYLMDKRSVAQKEYVETVTSSSYRQTVKEWREYLESPEPVNPPLENTQKSVHRLADELIWNTYQLALEEGNAITEDTEAEALHELRKTCKKLRYLMEFFQSLYPAKKIKELIKALKELQDNLGDFNDYHVHIGILKDFKKSSSNEDAAKAVKKLIKTLKQKQHSTRNSFAERFRTFSLQDNQDEFRGLFTKSFEG